MCKEQMFMLQACQSVGAFQGIIMKTGSRHRTVCASSPSLSHLLVRPCIPQHGDRERLPQEQ